MGEKPEIISKVYLSLYWEVLVGNCDSALFLGGSDATSLEYISKKLGKETIRSINNSRSYGKQGSYSMSYNKTGRELMTPDELNVMDNENCILFIRGLYPFFTKKYDLEKHPNYNLTGDAKDEYKYDVKKVLQTGRHLLAPADANRSIRLFKEAQLADTREADREHRINTRPLVRKTAKGDACFEIRPTREVIPHLTTPDDQLNREQLRERQAVLENMELEDVSVPHDEAAKAEYEEELRQMEMLREFYGADTDEQERGEG